MESMRRAALVMAIVYGLSLVAVCLAACFMPAVGEHGCCAPEEGIGTAQRDCCAVTPGVAHAAPALGPTAVGSSAVAPVAVLASVPSRPASCPALSPSPPLVLRV
jgi:hypothetical protein